MADKKVRKDCELVKLTRVCQEIVRISKKYSYLWDDSSLWKDDDDDEEDNPDRELLLAYGWVAQDETFSIYLIRTGNQFLFSGSGLSYDNRKGLEPKDAARQINSFYRESFGLDAEELRKEFYDSLKKPLGRYFGKKGLEKLALGGKR